MSVGHDFTGGEERASAPQQSAPRPGVPAFSATASCHGLARLRVTSRRAGRESGGSPRGWSFLGSPGWPERLPGSVRPPAGRDHPAGKCPAGRAKKPALRNREMNPGPSLPPRNQDELTREMKRNEDGASWRETLQM